jgi:hypothetical protein
MQPTVSPAPTPPSSTFAGILAALAAPVQKQPSAWNDDDLADDVATLSYEQALRAHGRYKVAKPTSTPFTVTAKGVNSRTYEVASEANLAETEQSEISIASQAGEVESVDPQFVSNGDERNTQPSSPIFDRNLKCASITIRMSKAESLQLRKRADEAGLTISAYLRSCTFEAESLRALVKNTLAELRSTSNQAEKPSPSQDPARRHWRHWLARLWPRPRVAHSQAQA